MASFLRRLKPYRLPLGLAVGGVAIGSTLSNDLHIVRTTRVLATTASLISTYAWNLRGLQSGTPEYVEALSNSHAVAAIKLEELCAKNKGVFIKAAQFLASLKPIVPPVIAESVSILCHIVSISLQAARKHARPCTGRIFCSCEAYNRC